MNLEVTVLEPERRVKSAHHGLAVASARGEGAGFTAAVACRCGWSASAQAGERSAAVSDALRRYEAHRTGGGHG